MTGSDSEQERPFVKMHGLGNDFVVLDGRLRPLPIRADQARAIADRHTGVGCDQVLVLEPSSNADVFMRILNSDGGEVGACGNGARCVAGLLMADSGADSATIETSAGVLKARRTGNGVTIDMGPAGEDWREIPLAREADTLHLEMSAPPLADPVAVGMGNSHAVFFCDDPDAVPLAELGPELEHHPLFVGGVNVGVARIEAGGAIRLRVWERGTGLTLACGSGACAARVAAARRGLAPRSGDVILPGGTLHVDWREDGHVLLGGPTATAFTGTLDLARLTAGTGAGA